MKGYILALISLIETGMKQKWWQIVRHIVLLGAFFVLVFIARPFLYDNLRDFILPLFPANPEFQPGIQGAVNLIYLIIFGFTICCGSMALIFSTNILYGIGAGLFTFVIMSAFMISEISTVILSILAFVSLVFGIITQVKIEKQEELSQEKREKGGINHE